MLLITRDGLIVVFQNREIQILLLLVEHAREIDLRWYDLRPFGIPSSVSNNHIYRSSTISPDHLFEISIRIPELFIHSSRSFQDFFFYKNLFTSIHSNIFYRKRKKETEENDRFNFDAKWIKKVSGPLWIFYDSCLKSFVAVRFECRDSGRKLLRLKIFIGRAAILGSWKSNWKEEGNGDGGGNHLVNFGKLGANYPYFAVRANRWSVN